MVWSVDGRAGTAGWTELTRLSTVRRWSRCWTGFTPATRGRQSYPLVTYVKLLLLQQWYGLSDPGLEEAVDDRLSFRRFAGLPVDEGVPDHSTIWRFRQELAAHRLA